MGTTHTRTRARTHARRCSNQGFDHDFHDLHCDLQVQFMTYAFGGPEEYHGKDMFRAHERLVREKGMNDHHFDVIVKHLVAALKAFNVPEASHRPVTVDCIPFCMCYLLAVHLLGSSQRPCCVLLGICSVVRGWAGIKATSQDVAKRPCRCARFLTPALPCQTSCTV